MTRLVLIPTDTVVLILESELPVEQLAGQINSGKWVPPPAYSAALTRSLPGGCDLWLRAVCLGSLVLASPLLAKTFAGADETGLPALTARQQQVLDGLVGGLTTKEIATRTGISRRTVMMHVSRLKILFGGKNRAQVASRAVALGMMKRITRI